jgi:WD40 repeat protein
MPDLVDPTSMLEHIGDCIHEFSLKALPWAEIDHSGLGGLSTLLLGAERASNEKRVFTWLDGMEPSELKEQDFELRLLALAISPPASDQLFVADEYFAEGSDHSDSAQIERPSSDYELSALSFSSRASPGLADSEAGPNVASETGAPEEAHSEADDSDSVSHVKEGDGWKAIFNRDVPRVLDVDLVHTLEHDGYIYCVRFSADGKYVATGCDTSAQIFDVINGEMVCALQDDSIDKNERTIYSVCFSPDGRYLVTGGRDKLIKVCIGFLVFRALNMRY